MSLYRLPLVPCSIFYIVLLSSAGLHCVSNFHCRSLTSSLYSSHSWTSCASLCSTPYIALCSSSAWVNSSCLIYSSFSAFMRSICSSRTTILPARFSCMSLDLILM